jgi:acyl carrier protein
MSASLFSDVTEILADFAAIPAAKMTEHTDLYTDLELCSLDVMNIVVVFEDKYHLAINDDDITQFKTIGDIVYYLRNALKDV